MKKEKSNQTIKCDVESCEHHNNSCDECDLREIEVKKQCGCEDCECEEETVCASYEQKQEEE